MSLLKLPDKIEYIYSAAGQKLLMRHTEGSITKQMVYASSLVYKKEDVNASWARDYLLTGEGRAVENEGTWDCQYFLTDHLGNTRVVAGMNSETRKAEAKQTNDYYPFGMEMPNRQFTLGSSYRFGYQGQFAEKDEETGYNHFEARDWDGRIGRWMAPDPARQFYSSYLGMGNNPVSGVDPDGREYYHNWFGGQKWFDGNDQGNWFWKLNTGNGFDYTLEDGTVLHDVNMGDVQIKTFQPEYIKRGTGSNYTATPNPKHPNFNSIVRRDKRYENFEAERRAWEGPDGFKNKGLPTMSLTATAVFTGGLIAAGELFTYYAGVQGLITLTLDVLDVANNVHTLSGSPVYGSGTSLLINGVNIFPDIHGFSQGQITGNPTATIFSTVGVIVDATNNN